MNKYRNKKTKVTLFGKEYSFDSQIEGKRAFELLAMQDAMYINSLVFQPKFLLQEGFVRNGKKHREINYIADFSYIADEGQVIEDVKGVKTKEYQLKKKMFLKKYDFIFKEVYFKHGKFETKGF